MKVSFDTLGDTTLKTIRYSFDIVSTRNHLSGVWMPVEWAAEDALAKISGARVYCPNIPRRQYWMRSNRLARVIGKYLPQFCPSVCFGLPENVFLFMMILRREYVPILEDRSREKWIYLFDTWEPGWKSIERSLKSAKNVQAVFMSSLQAANHFQGRFSFPVTWLPQAANSKEFNPIASDWSKKKNIILNIGRTNKLLNTFFEKFAQKHGYEYIRPLVYGDVNFEKREDLLKVLYQSKIIVVHPKDLDSPEISGCVSTLTARYFEAYQSSGVVCGFKPSSGEFNEVFGGMPFVSYEDSDSFESQLLEALEHPDIWIAAGLRCKAEHTWEKRLQSCFR